MDKVKKVGTKKMQDAYNKAFDESPVVDRVKNPIKKSEKVQIIDEVAKAALEPKAPKSKFFREPSYVDIPDLPVGVTDDLAKAEKVAEKSGLLQKFGKLAKGLGLGAAAMGVMGAGKKAYAGDVMGAGADIGQMLVPDEIQIGNAGEGSDIPSTKPQFGVYEKSNPNENPVEKLKRIKAKLGY